MSADIIARSISPSPSPDPDRQERPGSLPFPPSNGTNPSHHHHHHHHHHHRQKCSSKHDRNNQTQPSQTSSDSSSSDAGLGQDQHGDHCEERETRHDQDGTRAQQSSGISSGASSSPETPTNKHTHTEEDDKGHKIVKQTAIEREEADLGGIVREDSDKDQLTELRGAEQVNFSSRFGGKLPRTVSGPARLFPKDGVFKMSSKAKLQSLLAKIANWDEFYAGVEDLTPTSAPTSGDWNERGPSSFPPFEGSPSSQPPSFLESLKSGSLGSPFYHLCNTVLKDGKTSEGDATASPRKLGGVWTLNLLDGNLFLFKTNPESKDGEKDDEMDGEKDDETELVEGIELSKLLTKSPSESHEGQTGHYYFNLPFRVINPKVNDPHVTPVYTPPHRTDLIIYRKRDPSTMTPTEYILHHNTVFLVLEEEEDSGGPIINTVMHDQMIEKLERLANEGINFPNASFNPVVNIKFDPGHAHSETNPNSLALYFTGKENKYRYYVHVDDKDGKLVPVKKKLPRQVDDWIQHLEFSLYYPPAVAMTTSSQPSSLKTGQTSFEQGSPCSGGADGASPGKQEKTTERQRKCGMPAGNDLATAIMMHAKNQASTADKNDPKIFEKQ